MENATKALIIAAAVLITIVLVALGVLLIRNASDTSKQAQTVGNSIGLATSNSIGSIKSDLNYREKSAEDFNSFTNDLNPANMRAFIDVIMEKNEQLEDWEKITIKGYLYYGDCDDSLSGLISDNVSADLEDLKPLNDPTNNINMQIKDKLKEKFGDDWISHVDTTKQYMKWRFGKDKDGYINIAEYIVGFDFI